MQVTVEIPDDMALSLIPAGQDPARTTLEAIAILENPLSAGSSTSAPPSSV